MNPVALRVAALVGAALLVPLPAAAFTAIVVSPLRWQYVPPTPLFHPTGKSVNVVVIDARADKSFIAYTGDPSTFVGFGTPAEGDLAVYVGKAATDALPVFGFASGSDLTLTITIRDVRVDMYLMSPFSPWNCMGYGVVEVSLKDAGGAELLNRTLHLAYYENTIPVSSTKEVTTTALSRIYSQMAWEAVTAALLEPGSPEPDAAAIESFAAAVGGSKDDVLARLKIFWLGIARQPLPAVKDELNRLFRAEGEQKVFQAAVEALGKLGVGDVRPTIEGILAGTQKVGDWDNEDDEHVWYLMRALAGLGEKDLASFVPKTKLNMPSKLQDLIAFESTGTIPELSPAAAAIRKEAKRKLEKKRK